MKSTGDRYFHYMAAVDCIIHCFLKERCKTNDEETLGTFDSRGRSAVSTWI